MIIWGSRGRTSVERSGDFYCPDCDDYKVYDHKKVKQWFTLYFIPIFPTKELGEYIECKECKSTYKQDVLEHDPRERREEIQALFFLATRDIMVKIALADGRIEVSEIEQIAKSFEQITKRIIKQDQIKDAIATVKSDDISINEYASNVAPLLNDVGKEIVLRGAIAVAKSDGTIQQEELEMLHSLAMNLDLPNAYANGIFNEEEVPLKSPRHRPPWHSRRTS